MQGAARSLHTDPSQCAGNDGSGTGASEQLTVGNESPISILAIQQVAAYLRTLSCYVRRVAGEKKEIPRLNHPRKPHEN